MNHTILMYDPSTVLYGPGGHGPGCMCPVHAQRNRPLVTPEMAEEIREAARATLRKLAREFDRKMNRRRKSSARRTGALMT